MGTIPLTKGYIALVDDEDYEWLNQRKWQAQVHRNTVYAFRKDGRKTVRMHRLILSAPSKIGVDHINGNGLDNRKANLRLANNSQNLANMRKPKHGKTSKYKGVYKFRNSFAAQIKINKQKIYLGCFKNEEEAALAYNTAAIKYFGEYARVNEVARGHNFKRRNNGKGGETDE